MPDRIRVALIEDNEVFREAIELLLGLDAEVEVMGSAPDGTDAVGLCERTDAEVLVVDYRSPQTVLVDELPEFLR